MFTRAWFAFPISFISSSKRSKLKKKKKTVEAKNARSDKKNDHVQIFIIIIQNFGKKEVFSVDHSNFYVGQVFKLV